MTQLFIFIVLSSRLGFIGKIALEWPSCLMFYDFFYPFFPVPFCIYLASQNECCLTLDQHSAYWKAFDTGAMGTAELVKWAWVQIPSTRVNPWHIWNPRGGEMGDRRMPGLAGQPAELSYKFSERSCDDNNNNNKVDSNWGRTCVSMLTLTCTHNAHTHTNIYGGEWRRRAEDIHLEPPLVSHMYACTYQHEHTHTHTSLRLIAIWPSTDCTFLFPGLYS